MGVCFASTIGTSNLAGETAFHRNTPAGLEVAPPAAGALSKTVMAKVPTGTLFSL